MAIFLPLNSSKLFWSRPKQSNYIRLIKSILEEYLSGKLQLLASEDLFCIIRTVVAFRIQGVYFLLCRQIKII